MKNQLEYLDNDFKYINEKQYKKALVDVHKYAEDVLTGLTDFDKSQRRLERVLEVLGESATADLPDGGICFIDCDYDLALDDIIVKMCITHLESYCRDFVIACIRNNDPCRADEIINMIITHLSAGKERNVIINAFLITLFNWLIGRCNTTIVDYSMWAIYPVYTQEMKDNCKRLIEKNITTIDDSIDKTTVLYRLVLMQKNDESIEQYKLFIEQCIANMPKSYKEWRKDCSNGDKLGKIITSAIVDFWNLENYEFAFELYRRIVAIDENYPHKVWTSEANVYMKLYLNAIKKVFKENEWANIYALAPDIVDSVLFE